MNTPTPWEAVDRKTIRGPFEIGNPGKPGELVGLVPDWCGPENARRIVACVNACAGIQTEWLEGVEVKKVLSDWLEFARDVIPGDPAGADWLDILRAKTASAVSHPGMRHATDGIPRTGR